MSDLKKRIHTIIESSTPGVSANSGQGKTVEHYLSHVTGKNFNFTRDDYVCMPNQSWFGKSTCILIGKKGSLLIALD